MAIIASYTSVADQPPTSYSGGNTSTYKTTDVAEYIDTSAGIDTGPRVTLPSKPSDFWFACNLHNRGSSNSPLYFIEFFDTTYSTSQGLFRITQTGTSTGLYKIQMWSGSAWVDVSAETFAIASNQTHRFDLHIKVADTGGVIQFWVDGVLVVTGTIDDTKVSTVIGINQFQLYNFASGLNGCYWSAMIIADEDVRAMKMIQVLPTGNGANTGWTGAYTDVDEVGYNDADFATIGTSGAKETYTHAALPAGYATGYEVKAVVISGRMAKGANNPLGIKALVRIGGVDYEGASFNADIAAAPRQVVMPVSPATGVAWTYAEAAAEFGFSSYTI